MAKTVNKAAVKKAAVKKAAVKKAAVKKAAVKKAAVKKAAVKKAAVKKAVVKSYFETAVVHHGTITEEMDWQRRFASSMWMERPCPEGRSPTARRFVAGLRGRSARDIATTVMDMIDQANAGKLRKGRPLTVQLIAAWSKALADGPRWESIEIQDPDEREYEVMADPERRWVIDVYDFIRKLLRLDGGHCDDNTALLLFNMIEAGKLPRAKPGSYLSIG
jgi:hypothetical protein